MSDLWKLAELTPAQIVKSTRDYIVVATPTFWREMARENNREPNNYAIVNVQYEMVEAWASNLPLALNIIEQLQHQLNELKEVQNGSVVSLFPKNNPS